MEYVCCSCCEPHSLSDDEEVDDDSADKLSYVGTAAYEILRTKHGRFHHQLWNVTTGRVVDEVQYTPRGVFDSDGDIDPPDGHDDWFPQKMYDLIIKTERWCDIMSLGPPDGIFMTKFQEALSVLVEKTKGREKAKRITIRMMFGFGGFPTNCTVIIRELTKHLPDNPGIKLWVGSWTKGASWNHAKFIAVDGRYLHTGGHNLWDLHYLKKNPVHDLSFELEGRVASDAHKFANEQWKFVERMQRSIVGFVVDKLPDSMPMVLLSRVTVSEFPIGKVNVFPPEFTKGKMPKFELDNKLSVAMITMGRYGSIIYKHRPSDDAIVKMLESAKKSIRLAIQDLGPVCVPKTKITLPGCVWPKPYLSAVGRVIWEKDVEVEILLSNPCSRPNDLPMTEANYGNGWTCVDVAAEIMKTIMVQFPQSQANNKAALREKLEKKLRVCFIRSRCGTQYEDGMTIGMHAKHFIIDDICCYIGSQNLYVCDLAEWGVVVDNADAVTKIMNEYWNPMWAVSYTGEDCTCQAVMDGLTVDRDAEDKIILNRQQRIEMQHAICVANGGYKPQGSLFGDW